MKESGRTITWKVWGYMLGTMEDNIRDCTEMTKSMDLEFTPGQIKGHMMGHGTKGNSMGLGHTMSRRMGRRSLVFGKMEEE